MIDDVDVFEIYCRVGHSRLINRLISSGIDVRLAKSLKKKLIIRTNSRDRQKIIVIFDGLCYNYKIIKSSGLRSVLRALYKRPLLAVGALAIVLTFVLTPQFVYDVEIYGDCDRAKVKAVLAENGVKRGMPIKNVDEAALENALLDFDGVAFADVTLRGSTVVIAFQPELPPVNVFDVSSGRPLNSKYDAIVTRQIVFSGTAVKAKGDKVVAGDTLISGSLGEGDASVNVAARGEVYGLVTHTASVTFTNTRIVRAKSGKSHSETIVSFLGLSGTAKGSPYKMYETKTEYVGSKFFLPLDVKKITYYEIVDTEVSETLDSAKERLLLEVLAQVTATLPEGAVIKQKNTTVREIGGNYVFEAQIVAEQRIDADG